MTREPDKQTIDPRLHAWLDGELSSSETAAFEGDLRSGSTRNQLETFEHLGSWFRATRSRAPSFLAEDIERALRDAPVVLAHPHSVSPSNSKRRRAPARSWLDWAWVPAAAAALAAIVVLTAIPEDHGTDVPTVVSGGDPLPSEAVAPLRENPASPGQNPVPYVFSVRAGEANEVCLAGDFNRWRVCDARMEHVGEDLWTISVDLPPGRHQYMFVIDGRWVTDPQAMGYVDDGFGNQNAVLVI